MQVNAILSATGTGTQAGKKISTTISHLRQSQENKAVQLAQALNQFTTNTYVSTQVNEIGVTDFTPEKSSPTVTIASKLRLYSNSIYIIDVTQSDINENLLRLVGNYQKSTGGDADIFEAPTTESSYKNPEALASFLFLAKSVYESATNIQIYFVAPETTNYSALYQEIHITP